MRRDVEMGAPLSVPLEVNEFRWRPYGYLERGTVADASAQGGQRPGLTVVVLVNPELEAEAVAHKEGSRWRVNRAWREALDPTIITKRWQLFGIAAAVLTIALLFLVLVGSLPSWWPLIVTLAGGIVVGALVQMLGEQWATRRAAELRAREGFGAVQIAVEDEGAGYAQMLREFDQLAEAWTRGRVTDQSWEEVHYAVTESALEYAYHKTPADKANPEWMRAMKLLDDVRTRLGQQGVG